VGRPASRLTVAYDGAPFAGWARQPGRSTVQGELERALGTVLRREVTLTVAGRTDAGVHAWAQVASCAGEPPSLAAANALLPPEISVLAAEAAPEGFDARRDARSRTYCYRLLLQDAPDPFLRGRALHWPHPLALDALDACAAALPGEHDFSAFTPTETDHVRFRRVVARAEWVWGRGRTLELWIEADAFLRQMNRVLVGTMLEVASGRRTPEAFAALLEGAPRTAAGPTAAPHGLYLASVRY
jgi:tRNA pseudouridine38-40 synthase